MSRLTLAAALAAAMVATPLAAQAQISEAAHQAVLTALDDEYQAQSIYGAVIDKFGAVRPFSNIIRAEQRHEAQLIAILKANGLPVPANPYADGTKALPPVPASVAEACKIGVAAEIANAKLYTDKLLPTVADDPQISAVMISLANASTQKHLPAFQRCAGR